MKLGEAIVFDRNSFRALWLLACTGMWRGRRTMRQMRVEVEVDMDRRLDS
jgi:hypothetical protein